MSYVIQNFYNWNSFYILTPRFKFFFFLLNIEKFLFFLKYNSLLYFFNFNYHYKVGILNSFFRFFFSKQYFKILYKLNLNFVNNYANNLTSGSIFWIRTYVMTFIDSREIKFTPHFILPDENSLYNAYFYPIKVANIKFNTLHYKKFFFYFMLLWPTLWFQWNNTIRFYLNFIFITYYFQLSRFYNNYFLKIYNF